MNGAVQKDQLPQVRLEDSLARIWAKRKRILIISAAAGTFAALVNFLLLSLYFKSTATLLPDTEKNRLGALSQYAGIAQLAGVNVSGGDVARLFPVIVTSEAVLRNVIERSYQTAKSSQPVDLIQYFELDEGTREKNIDAALKNLKDLLSVSLETKTSVVTISLEMQEPQLAADVLNAIIDELDSFMRQKRITSATEQAKWISARLREVEVELRMAEDSLKDFREKNRRVSDSPDLLLRQERLIREVTVKSTIFVELKKQFELAKIEEIKNVTVVNVLDKARPPVKKDRPKRATNTAVAFLLVLFGTSAYFAFWPVYGHHITSLVNSVRRARKS